MLLGLLDARVIDLTKALIDGLKDPTPCVLDALEVLLALDKPEEQIFRFHFMHLDTNAITLLKSLPFEFQPKASHLISKYNLALETSPLGLSSPFTI